LIHPKRWAFEILSMFAVLVLSGCRPARLTGPSITPGSTAVPTATNTATSAPTVHGKLSIVIHILVVHWDQSGHIKTLLGSFNPAIGVTVRMKAASDPTSIPVESSGMTNENGLALLILINPIIDTRGNTQKVDLRIDGYTGKISCGIHPYALGYYLIEIYLEGKSIKMYYPNEQ